jgi:hypothetical protein
MKPQKHTSAFSIIEASILLCIASVLILLVMSVRSAWVKENVEMPRAFHAWEKQTGNPQRLTYEEWRSLLKATQREESAQTIILSH